MNDGLRRSSFLSSQEQPMTLHQRVVDEGLFRALSHAFDAPERFGGPPGSPKKKAQPKKGVSLLKRIKRVASKVGQAAFPDPRLEASVSLHSRVFTEEKKTLSGSLKKAASTFREYADITHPSHPWHKILSAAAKFSQGLKGGKQDSTEFVTKSDRGGSRKSAHDAGKSSSDGGNAARQTFEKLRSKTERARSYRLSRGQERPTRGHRSSRTPIGRAMLPRR